MIYIKDHTECFIFFLQMLIDIGKIYLFKLQHLMTYHPPTVAVITFLLHSTKNSSSDKRQHFDNHTVNYTYKTFLTCTYTEKLKHPNEQTTQTDSQLLSSLIRYCHKA